jgi:hypothetical protein
VASVLRSAAVRKVVPILSTSRGSISLSRRNLHLRNARVLFIMAKIHTVRNSQFMKAIRDVHSFFQEESFKIRNNHQVLPHTVIIECVCACLKVSPLAYEYRRYIENRF